MNSNVEQNIPMLFEPSEKLCEKRTQSLLNFATKLQVLNPILQKLLKIEFKRWDIWKKI